MVRPNFYPSHVLQRYPHDADHTDHMDHRDHTDHTDHKDHTDHTDHTHHMDHTDHTDLIPLSQSLLLNVAVYLTPSKEGLSVLWRAPDRLFC